VTEIGRRIEALPPEKRAALETKLGSMARATAPEPIAGREAVAAAPLSFAQQRL